MIGTLSRSLRVIDDGKGREINGTFAEFESEDAIILLGDPGMGKTTLFRDAAKANYTTVRNFLIDPHAAADDPLFLDALDEYRTIASGQDASSEVAKALCSLKKPKFRLSCRAADWFGSTDQEVLRVASASGRVVVLELSPLSRDEILNAVQGIVQNPVVFLDEADSAGLGRHSPDGQILPLPHPGPSGDEIDPVPSHPSRPGADPSPGPRADPPGPLPIDRRPKSDAARPYSRPPPDGMPPSHD